MAEAEPPAEAGDPVTHHRRPVLSDTAGALLVAVFVIGCVVVGAYLIASSYFDLTP